MTVCLVLVKIKLDGTPLVSLPMQLCDALDVMLHRTPSGGIVEITEQGTGRLLVRQIRQPQVPEVARA